MNTSVSLDPRDLKRLIAAFDEAFTGSDDAQQLARLAHRAGIDSDDPLFHLLVLNYIGAVRQQRALDVVLTVADDAEASAARIEKSTEAVLEAISPESLMNRWRGVLAVGGVACLLVGMVIGGLLAKIPVWQQHRQGLEAVMRVLASPNGPLILRFFETGELERIVLCIGQGWQRKGNMCYPHADRSDPEQPQIRGWRLEP
ncbi:MAG: hypothetical protein DI537_13660 [Stutzerimonas stutzeri]|nr:MAG: hypothetical protein DI537_13660 [Stutzerimonas stutzeri]